MTFFEQNLGDQDQERVVLVVIKRKNVYGHEESSYDSVVCKRPLTDSKKIERDVSKKKWTNSIYTAWKYRLQDIKGMEMEAAVLVTRHIEKYRTTL